MPDLLDRVLGLLGPGEDHLAVSPLIILAAMREIQRGEVTQGVVTSKLGLTPADEAGFINVMTQIFVAATLPVDEFLDVLWLGSDRNRAEQLGQPYYTKQMVKDRLGI